MRGNSRDLLGIRGSVYWGHQDARRVQIHQQAGLAGESAQKEAYLLTLPAPKTMATFPVVK